MTSLLVALLLASPPLVRTNQGRLVELPAGGRPLITSMTCDLTWLRWTGGSVVDMAGTGWGPVGNPTHSPKNGAIPPSVALNDTDYYRLPQTGGTGNDVLDRASLSVCVVVYLDSLPGGSQKFIFDDGLYNNDGWMLFVGQSANSNKAIFDAASAGGTTGGWAISTNQVVLGLNVICGGFDANTNTSYVRLNGTTTATKSKGAAMTPATTRVPFVGRYGSANFSFNVGKVIEVCGSSSLPSEALFAPVHSEVKAKTGTTAW